MCRKDDRVIAREPLDQVADLLDLIWIQTDRRFVQNHDIGVVDDRLSDSDALLVTAREPFDQFLAAIDQVGQLHRLIDAAGNVLRRYAFDPRYEGEVALDRHFWIERGRFGKVTDTLADLHRLLEDVETRDSRRPASSWQIPRQNAHSRRLARTIGA